MNRADVALLLGSRTLDEALSPTGDAAGLERSAELYGRGSILDLVIRQSIHDTAARAFGRLLGECIDWWTR